MKNTLCLEERKGNMGEEDLDWYGSMA